MIQICTDKRHLIDRFNLKSMEDEFVMVQDESIDPSKIIITDPEKAPPLMKKHPFSKVMVLSDAPSFEEGSRLLPLGIRGYGNTYMHYKHLKQAMITIESGAVWLYPAFMRQLISGATATRRQNDILNRLTERERETALLVKEGKSNKEIAKELEITERTVKQHMSNIFEKLGVSDRLSLAMLFK